MNTIWKSLWSTLRLAATIAALTMAAAAPAAAQSVARASSAPMTATLNSAVGTPLFEQQSVVSFYVSGLTASGATLTVEGSNDGKSPTDVTKAWFTVQAIPFSCPPTPFTTFTTDQAIKTGAGGLTDIRVRVSTAGTGTINVSYMAIPGTFLDSNACKPAGGGAYPLATNVNAAGTYGLTSNVVGGAYIETCVATSWNGATAQLQSLGPDGSTFLTNGVPAIGTNTSQTILVGAGITVNLLVSGTPTNLNCKIYASGG